MNKEYFVSNEEIELEYNKLKKEAIESGYNLNPDEDFTKQLIESLLINNKRYGYPSCPCRLATGIKENDLDIICPCDYRDQDLIDYGFCYCGLYVSQYVIDNKIKPHSIPDRRLKEIKKTSKNSINFKISYPIWRCKVCGYICARNEPPEKCPICKASKDRFEIFIDIK